MTLRPLSPQPHRTQRDSVLRPLATCIALCIGLSAGVADAASLSPTRRALLRQDAYARANGLSRLQDDRAIKEMVRRGGLRLIPGNENYEVKEDVRHPYGLPETKLFIEQISAAYHETCGEPLVVTSLVRPRNRQLQNSSPLSVHPTGMAIDLRRSWSRRCRSWISGTLLDLEAAGAIEAAREKGPPHYHVVVFPDEYRAWAVEQARRQSSGRTARATASYEVQNGDSLWKIARRHGTTIDDIRDVNGLRSSTIRPGQVLSLPGS